MKIDFECAVFKHFRKAAITGRVKYSPYLDWFEFCECAVFGEVKPIRLDLLDFEISCLLEDCFSRLIKVKALADRLANKIDCLISSDAAVHHQHG
ncbi:hypothetical protein [Synechococcus sp. KORDI-100]|uniref:hypothetical protein n=1 Tax=Synechococcus sp. KORDI-100 TaxID=1280380 RepID=UPI00138E2A04|nr:hypothetical protein [Synechococcus sp. KORDI-100]